jgi:hypothetical protein
MEIAELFEMMESTYRSAIPWPWPRTMTGDELGLWMAAWPNLKPTEGVFIGGEARIKAIYPGTVKYFSVSIDLNSTEWKCGEDGQPESVG